MICRALFFVFVISASASAAEAQCGIERWPVKTTTDPDSQYVSRAVFPTTIAQLRSLPTPRPLLQANRIAPVEETLYSVTATLISVQSEGDSDYRLVLADGEGRTIIAAIPSPACSDGGVFASDIASARASFDAKLVAPADRSRSVSMPVEIRGIGFFDFLNGQPGAAPNGIELHPVTSINFSPLVAPAPPASGRRRAVAPVTGHSACTTPVLTLALSTNSTCPGVPVTLSWKVSDPAASVMINGIGGVLPNSGSTTIGSTASILYSGRATSACGAGDEAVTVLTIVPAASASLTGPASLQQGSAGTLSVSVANANVWSLASSLGNSMTPASGSNTGSFAVQYVASKSGSDVISLSATSNECGSIQRATTVPVISSTPQPQPQPQPQPGGSLRCCDGTISPTCTNCASKQGCCSHHGGVCGC